MILAALLLLAFQPPTDVAWEVFERRQRGWGESPSGLDAGSVVRRGGRVRAWIHYAEHLSGLPDPRFTEQVEIDCARHRSRTLASLRQQGGRSSYGTTPHSAFAPILSGSTDAALAVRLCRSAG